MAKLKSVTENLNERLGSDCKLPINGNFEPVAGMDLLIQDIQQLLLTIPGERVNRPQFGCTLRTYVWENIETAAERGAASIKTALTNFEPRISVISVDSEINRNTSLIVFHISFVVKSTDQVANLVFPFRAGTALSFA